jgi:hypothetical protein
MKKISITLSNKKGHLVITITEFEDGFANDRKTGIIALDPEYDPEELLEASKQYNWSLGDKPDNLGFYPVKREAKITN